MRLSIVYGAVATAAVAAHDARGDALDSMCVVTNDNSGMLYEMPCGLLPLHEKDNGGTRQMEEAGAKVKRQIVYETSKVVVIAIDQMISATDDKRPTTFSGTYATAHVERHDPFDGVAKDLPTFVLNIPTVLTKTFAAETIEMAVSTGEDDTLERFTIQPSTVTQTIPAQSASLTASAKAKRQEPVVSSVESGTTTTAFLFDPVATTLISVPTISQSVSVIVVLTTVTATGDSGLASQNTTAPASATTTATITTAVTTQTVTTVTNVQNQTSLFTQTHSTQIVTLPQSSTSFITAGDATVTSNFANGTTHVVVTSYATAPEGAVNGSTLSTTVRSFLNISEFTATSLTLTHAPSTLLSISTTSSDVPMTTQAVPSGSIGDGMPAASTTQAITSGSDKTKNGPGKMGLYSAIFVGLMAVFLAEKYFGPAGKGPYHQWWR